MSLLDSLKWRYAAKKLNGVKVPAEKLNFILDDKNLISFHHHLVYLNL